MVIDPPGLYHSSAYLHRKQGDLNVAGEGLQIFQKCFFIDYLLVLSVFRAKHIYLFVVYSFIQQIFIEALFLRCSFFYRG